MSEFLKPQNPLQHKDGAFVYPLTTADQVILDDNNRLNFALENMVYASEEHQEDATTPLDADTLSGHPVEDFVQVEAFETYAGSIDTNIKENTRPKAGFIYPLAGSVVPDGFLLCDGAEYSRVQYEELFAAIGTIYGNGNGSTTFNVPNLQTRVPIGAGEGYGLGDIGGEAEHTLTVDEMPSHAHKMSGDINYGGFTSGSTHYVNNRTVTYDNNSTLSAGGSQPHNNMQPYTVVNYIIATGKDTGVSVSDIVFGAQAIPLEVQYGGTGATNAEDARVNLGVAHAVEDTDYSGCYYRTINGSTEWINPPMVGGVEYRTTERFNGKAVYTKLLIISPSSITIQTPYLNHGVSNLDIGLSIEVNWYRVADASWRTFPASYHGNTAWCGQALWADMTNICFELGTSLLDNMKVSSENIFVTLKYTKTV